MICRRGLADSFVATALIEPDFINGIGQNRTLGSALRMSALPPKADIRTTKLTPVARRVPRASIVVRHEGLLADRRPKGRCWPPQEYRRVSRSWREHIVAPRPGRAQPAWQVRPVGRILMRHSAIAATANGATSCALRLARRQATLVPCDEMHGKNISDDGEGADRFHCDGTQPKDPKDRTVYEIPLQQAKITPDHSGQNNCQHCSDYAGYRQRDQAKNKTRRPSNPAGQPE